MALACVAQRTRQRARKEPARQETAQSRSPTEQGVDQAGQWRESRSTLWLGEEDSNPRLTAPEPEFLKSTTFLLVPLSGKEEVMPIYIC